MQIRLLGHHKLPFSQGQVENSSHYSCSYISNCYLCIPHVSRTRKHKSSAIYYSIDPRGADTVCMSSQSCWKLEPVNASCKIATHVHTTLRYLSSISNQSIFPLKQIRDNCNRKRPGLHVRRVFLLLNMCPRRIIQLSHALKNIHHESRAAYGAPLGGVSCIGVALPPTVELVHVRSSIPEMLSSDHASFLPSLACSSPSTRERRNKKMR